MEEVIKMTVEMKYSRVALNACADMVKAYIKHSKQVTRKNELFVLARELKDCYDYAADNLNSALFDFDFSDAYEFYKHSYDCKKWTVKELRMQEKNAVRFICNELNAILRMINTEPEKYELPQVIW